MSLRKFAKWEAYERCKGMSKELAMKRYVSELRAIDPQFALPSDKKGGGAKSAGKKKRRAPKPGTGTMTPKSGEPLRKEFKRAADFAFVSKRFRMENQRVLLYAYYKQATVGPCNQAAPSVFSGRRKYAGWRAWGNLFDMDKETAMRLYVDQVKKIAPEFANSSANALLEQEGEEDLDEHVDEEKKIKMIAEVDDATLEKRIKAAQAAGGFVYLITGASGFIGKHLMDLLVERNENSVMVCITRPGSNFKLARQAVKSGYASQVIPLVGNIAKPNFELSGNILKILQTGGRCCAFHPSCRVV